jgi:hypothetical protein
MNTDDLIARLGREVTLVKPLPAPAVRTAFWAAWATLYLGLMAATKIVTMSTDGVPLTSLYVLQQASALTMGITAAAAALRSVVPGAGARYWRLPGIAAGAWLALVLFDVIRERQQSGSLGIASETDWPCVVSIVVGAAVLGIPLLRMLRRGAALTPRTTAILAAVAVLSLANVEACLTRAHAFTTTVVIWHGSTAIVVTALVAARARRWLPWLTAAHR